MRKVALGILVFSLACPAQATTYYLATVAGGGSDSNNGTSSATPWLSPNHPVNCGDVIIAAASASYSPFNFTTGKWGTVTCPAGNHVAWLKCVTFDACKIFTSSGQGMYVDQSYWGVQGWEITTTPGDTYGTCFNIQPNYLMPVQIHHIVFANDIANGCSNGGFSGSNGGNVYASIDYVAFVGNIAYDAAQGSAYCTSGFNIYQPIQSDNLPGTHIYIAGNFAWKNFNPDPCSGGPPSDGQGIILDTLNGSQGGLPRPYAAQVVVQNNITFLNGGRGIFEGQNSSAKIYIKDNTLYGDMGDTNQNYTNCGELNINISSLTEAAYNLVATGSGTGCGANIIYALSVMQGDGTDQIHNNFAYSASGSNTAIYNSGTFAYGPNNTFGTSPTFVNPIDPGAPSCGSSSSVPNCMATVIANFTPTTAAAAGYGYRVPVATRTYDPLFPQWLCNVNLPEGLVTMGCLAAPSLPAGVTINGEKIQ